MVAACYLQVVPLTANDVGDALVIPFQFPLNAGPIIVVPAGIEASQLALVAVTIAPLWVHVPSFHIFATVCPLGKAQVSVQLLMAAVPVFWMVFVAPNCMLFCIELL
jgi:hypothetical protein